MPDPLFRRLDRIAGAPAIPTLAALFVLLTAAFQFVGARLKRYSGTSSGLERPNRRTPGEIYRTLGDYGPEGRRLYIRSVSTLDTAYPVVYGLLLVLVILWEVRNWSSEEQRLARRRLALLPLCTMLTDYTENPVILRLLSQFPRESTTLERALPVLTNTKWTLAALSLAAVTYLFATRDQQAVHK